MTDNPIALVPETSSLSIQERLARFLPLRIILRMQDGKPHGLTELSFAMDWSDTRVQIDWSGEAFSILGKEVLDAVKQAEYSQKKFGGLIFDPLAADCPVEIDWLRWLDATSKYERRNAKFTVRPSGIMTLRALDAEQKLAASEKALADTKVQLTGAWKNIAILNEERDKVLRILRPDLYAEADHEEENNT